METAVTPTTKSKTTSANDADPPVQLSHTTRLRARYPYYMRSVLCSGARTDRASHTKILHVPSNLVEYVYVIVSKPQEGYNHLRPRLVMRQVLIRYMTLQQPPPRTPLDIFSSYVFLNFSTWKTLRSSRMLANDSLERGSGAQLIRRSSASRGSQER